MRPVIYLGSSTLSKGARLVEKFGQGPDSRETNSYRTDVGFIYFVITDFVLFVIILVIPRHGAETRGKRSTWGLRYLSWLLESYARWAANEAILVSICLLRTTARAAGYAGCPRRSITAEQKTCSGQIQPTDRATLPAVSQQD